MKEAIIKAAVPFIIGFIAFQLLFHFVIFPNVAHSNNNVTSESIEISQTDSLQHVIDSLQTELESQAQRFDNKEKQYKETIFEYEFGISWIEKYHTNAYEDFHRMLSHREQYSREDAIENKKRLKGYEYNR
jgi:hypothetical protein